MELNLIESAIWASFSILLSFLIFLEECNHAVLIAFKYHSPALLLGV